jgi:hypothetical protein
MTVKAIRSSKTSVFTRSTRRHIPEDDILHSHRRENLKSYIALTGFLCSRDVMCLLQLDSYIPKEGTLHNHRREHLKSYK